MSTIVRRLIDRFYPNQFSRVIIHGLDYSGKTTLLYFLKLHELIVTTPSIGFNVETMDIPTSSGKTFNMTGWDVGTSCGSIRHTYGLLRWYLKGLDAFIWVVDGSDRERLMESVEILMEIVPMIEEAEQDTEHTTGKVPILILATKFDKPNPLSIDEIRIAFAKSTPGRLASVFKIILNKETARNVETSGIPEAFGWLSTVLEISKSMKGNKSSSALSSDNSAGPNLRAPNLLAQKLESWLVRSETDIPTEKFLEKFRSYTLPEWDHYTHIRIAYVVLKKYGRQEGKDIIFQGLKDYIANSLQTKGRTFHVSMTYFWIQIVHLGIRNTPPTATATETSTSLNDFARFLLINPHVVDGNLWSDYYSKELLMSPKAKAEMVLPDKKPLPNLVARDAITNFGA